MLKGFDTSSNQLSTANTILAKRAGYQFCFCRIGCGTKKDKCFETDVERCKGSGIKVGIYFATTGLTREQAVKDAQQTLEWLDGRKLDLPVVYDMEVRGMATKARKIPNAIQYNAYAGIMRTAGYPTMYYAGANRWRNYIEQDMIYDPLWLAAYGKNDGSMIPIDEIRNIGREVDVYQYTSAAVPSDFYPYKLDRDMLLTSYEKVNAMPATRVMYTTREVTVWTAPGKKDEWRLKKVPEGYPVSVYPESIPTKTADGDAYKRTLKNCYILEKYLRG